MLRNVLLFAALGGLVAHAPMAHAGKPPAAPPSHLEIVATQPRLEVDPIKIGGLGAIAAGATLVEFGIRKASEANGERRLDALRGALAGYDFPTRFQQALETHLAAAGLEVDVASRSAARDDDAPLAPGEPARVLSITPRHAMDSNFESLSITVDARMLDRSLGGAGRLMQKMKGKNGYADNRQAYGVRFRMQRIAGSGSSEDAARWVALGGEELGAMLDAGLDELAAMIVYDLTPAGIADRGVRKQLGFVEFDGEPLRGRMVEVDGRRWLRDRIGLQAAHAIDGTTRTYSAKATLPAVETTLPTD